MVSGDPNQPPESILRLSEFGVGVDFNFEKRSGMLCFFKRMRLILK